MKIRGAKWALLAGVFTTSIGIAVAISATSKPKLPSVETDIGVDPIADLASLKVSTSLRDEIACSEGVDSGFSNPVAGYTLCYPRAWGFTDLVEPGPLKTLNGTQLGSVRLVSEEAFPWPRDTTMLARLLERKAIGLEISLVPSDRPNAVETGDCEPTRSLGELVTCEQAITPEGEPTAAPPGDGLVELFAQWASPDEEQIVLRARWNGDTQGRETIEHVLASIRQAPGDVQ